MKKRLRKKKRVGEFQELGFEVSGTLRPGLDRAELGAFVERLVRVVEARQLTFGGGVGAHDALHGFIAREGRGSASQDDRDALSAFLRADAAVMEHGVGELWDAWWGW